MEVERTGRSGMTLDYLLEGDLAALTLPRPGERTTDPLWKHTCFEAFVRAAGADSYYEFNFATSLRSAAYAFDSYRSGMRALDEAADERLAAQLDTNRCRLEVGLDLACLPDLSSDTVWRLGLSAVIEDANGGLSYWALLHPPGKPDFHHAESCALELLPVEQ